ncbi:MAG: GNAT family N-acetyltransferase [Pseudomonadota bacterium]|nr:GNAT family N-acetyltransferase [Pseudomonadota bacterium]
MSEKIRPARKSDVKIILQFVKELAAFERLSHQVNLTEMKVKKSFLAKNSVAKTLIIEKNGVPCGFAVYFYNFSTFLGSKGIYLEDLYIRSEFRRQGLGRKVFAYLANLAVKEKCQRFEWSVLDWNKPAIKFYRELGARPLKQWQIQRLDAKAIRKLFKKSI